MTRRDYGATSGQLGSKFSKSEKKPYKYGVGNAISRALGNEVSGKIHGKIHEVERENVGVESAHKSELVVERGLLMSARHVKRRARTRSKQQFAKLQNKHNPALKKGAFKRQLQKRRLKRQYQKQAKAAAKATKGTAAIKKVTVLITKNPMAIVIIAIAFLFVAVIQSCMGSALTMINSLSGAIGETTYLADDNEINEVALLYIQWETDLLITTRNAALIRPGYNEYRYNIIGNVGHNPFELIAFLTVRYDDFTFSAVEPTMREIFAAQYTLTHISTTEIRGSGENAHTVQVLTTTLTARNFSDVIAERITTEDERERFDLYMYSKGNRQIVGSPFAFNWFPYITSLFGYRVHPIHGDRRFHEGLDISVPNGTPILAGGAGVVVSAGWQGGYGLTVVIDYGNGVTALYAHCLQLLVSAGQTVNKGDIIALVGSTGDSTGPHLHIEVRVDGVLMNPLFFTMTNSP